MGSKSRKSSKAKKEAAQAAQKKNMTILAAVGIFAALILLLLWGSQSKDEVVVADAPVTAVDPINSSSETTDSLENANPTGAILPQNGEVPAKGMLAPDFHLTTLKGEDVSLSDYKGQVVAVNLWATWCPPCRAELPGINAVYDAYAADGLVMLAVNGREEESLVSSYIESEGFTFPVLLDPEGQVMSIYSIYSFPTTYIIDRDGVIRHVQTGPISAQDFEMVISPLL